MRRFFEALNAVTAFAVVILAMLCIMSLITIAGYLIISGGYL